MEVTSQATEYGCISVRRHEERMLAATGSFPERKRFSHLRDEPVTQGARFLSGA
jgi:hypothetical protein